MGCWPPSPRVPKASAMHASPATTPPHPPRTQTSSDSGAAADLTGGAEQASRLVYAFGQGTAEGTRDMKLVLGGKGANLAEMTNLGVPVPPGFTIACEACVAYLQSGTYPPELRDEVARNIERLEHTTPTRCGDPANPSLVSVSFGSP